MERLRLVAADPRAEQTLRRIIELDRLCFRDALHYPEREHRARLRAPGVGVVAALSAEDAWAGAASFAISPERLFLDILAVRPEWRGRGVGPRLVEEVLARARAARVARVEVHAERRDLWGVDLVRFYARLGFAVAEDHADWVSLVRAP